MSRRRPIRLAAALALSTLTVLALTAGPATAHPAILLEITQPQRGARVGSDSAVVILAQRTLAGVDQASFVADLDGHPLDPATGRLTASPTPSVIHAGQQRDIALHGLAAGHHRLTISYRPDTDEPVSHPSVDFTVAPATSHHRSWLPLGIGIGIGVAVVAAAVVALRLRAGRPVRPAPVSDDDRLSGASARRGGQSDDGGGSAAELADDVVVVEGQQHHPGPGRDIAGDEQTEPTAKSAQPTHRRTRADAGSSSLPRASARSNLS